MVTGYVTVEEATGYINARYPSTDESLIRWTALSDGDKQVYLLQSVEALDQLPFHGKKFLDTQTYSFPRYPVATVPANVKAAQIENALKLSDTLAVMDAALYEKLRLFGITAYSIGNLSEKMSNLSAIYSGIVSAKSLDLLKPFLTGGYKIK